MSNQAKKPAQPGSIAHISLAKPVAVAKCPPTAPTALGKPNTAALFAALRRQIDACGPKPDKNDLVTTLIAICICEGANTSKRIIGPITSLGFNSTHVALMLKNGIWSKPPSVGWRRDGDGIYSMIE